MMRNSLTYRLVAASFLWVSATLLITAVILVLLFREHIEKRFDSALQDHLEELVAASDLSPAGDLVMTWKPSDPRFNRPHSGWYWEIVQSGTSVARSGSLWRENLAVNSSLADGSPHTQKSIGPEREALHLLAQQITYPDAAAPLLFMVAGPSDNIEKDIRTFSIQIATAFTVLGIGLLLAVWYQVHFGLKPLQSLRKALGDVRQGKAERLAQDFPAEVKPVVSELNGLLEHNSVLLERARTQAANLAHALKNPLTVIRNETRAIEDDPARIIRKQTDIMAASMDRYLSQARVAGRVGVLGARTEVNPVVKDLCFYMNRLYQDRNLEISHTLPASCWFRGEAQDLEEMLGNLIDNACKWADSRVEITVHCAAGSLEIVVEDDGTGIPEVQRQEALQRGRRLDEKVPGTGLGLDIVRDIAELYRGALHLDHARHGGVHARLVLPAE